MGNLWTCLSDDQSPSTKRISGTGALSSDRLRSSTKKRNSIDDEEVKMDDPVLREHALAAAAMILEKHRRQGGGAFDRAASVRCPPRGDSSKNREANMPRSYSTRPSSGADAIVVRPRLLVNQGKSGNAHFVLVHGGGFGAWCWYKSMALLQEGEFKVTAIDLTGSGIHSFDTNGITSLAQYVKPLTDFLDKLADQQKVILVGHDFGGACISYAMELFSHKISKAIFVAATMVKSGQNALEIFSQKEENNDLMGQAQNFLYANGKDHLPTAIELDKALLGDLLFNQSPTKDVALASVSMRPIPFEPVLERLTLSDQNYGCVRRFYIQTLEDNALPVSTQEQMVKASPPEQVFKIKGADHSPFFSKPQALHKLLLEISNLQ